MNRTDHPEVRKPEPVFVCPVVVVFVFVVVVVFVAGGDGGGGVWSLPTRRRCLGPDTLIHLITRPREIWPYLEAGMRGQEWPSASAELSIIDAALSRKEQPTLSCPNEMDCSGFLGGRSPCGIVQLSKLDLLDLLVLTPVDVHG